MGLGNTIKQEEPEILLLILRFIRNRKNEWRAYLRRIASV
jgi:hypothetical protein